MGLVGCFWNNNFVGAISYADDIVLEPSPSVLRYMLTTFSGFVDVIICLMLRRLNSLNSQDIHLVPVNPLVSHIHLDHVLLKGFVRQ